MPRDPSQDRQLILGRALVARPHPDRLQAGQRGDGGEGVPDVSLQSWKAQRFLFPEKCSFALPATTDETGAVCLLLDCEVALGVGNEPIYEDGRTLRDREHVDHEIDVEVGTQHR